VLQPRELTKDLLQEVKQLGFSDRQIARAVGRCLFSDDVPLSLFLLPKQYWSLIWYVICPNAAMIKRLKMEKN